MRELYDSTLTSRESTARELAPKPGRLPDDVPLPKERRQLVRRERLAVSPLTVLGITVVIVLFFLLIASDLQLYTVVSANDALEDRLEELKETNTQLEAAYESSYDLNRIETFARDRLGMHQPTESQIVCLDLSDGDRTEVLVDRSGPLSRLADSLRESIGYLLDSLRR